MMKKLSLYVFLVLMLTSCSEYMSKQKIENCADTKFSKEMASSWQVYYYVMEKGHSNEFELTLFLMRDSEFPIDRLIGSIDDLLSKENISEMGKKSSVGAVDTFKGYNYEIRKFLNLSVDKKVNGGFGLMNYKSFFEACELKQKETPNTFNALWKKADIKYIDISNLIKKFK